MTDTTPEDGSTGTKRPTTQTIAIVLATLLVSALFFQIALPFLTALILAGICAVLSQPFYRWILGKVGNRENAASGITLVVGLIIVVLPTLLIASLAVSQASTTIQGTASFASELSDDLAALQSGEMKLPSWFPYHDDLSTLQPKIAEKGSELLGNLASYLVSALTHFTSGTSAFILQLFAFLYALFFFLPMKKSVFAQTLQYSGLPPELQASLDGRIAAVSRATIKGTLTIGMIQGALGGLGFWAAGIGDAIFWGVVMMVLAAIPAVGATPVVICGAIYLGFTGDHLQAVGLALWGMLVVGSIDNVLRPKLVGREAAMSDLWIFVSTLGGLASFGAVGLVLGPVTAGLFITIWQAASDGKFVVQTPDTQEPAPNPDDSKASHQSFKMTATKADLEAEVEALRRELGTGPKKATGPDHD